MCYRSKFVPRLLIDLSNVVCLQTRGSDEEDHRDSDGGRRRVGSAHVPNNIPEVRAVRHTHDRVRLHAEFHVKRVRLNVSALVRRRVIGINRLRSTFIEDMREIFMYRCFTTLLVVEQ